MEQTLKSPELFVTVSGVFLGKTKTIGGTGGGCQLLSNKSGQRAHESSDCMRNTKKPCLAVAHRKTR